MADEVTREQVAALDDIAAQMEVVLRVRRVLLRMHEWEGDPDQEDALRALGSRLHAWGKRNRKHIRAYMKLPVDPSLPAVNRKLGDGIDKLVLRMSNLTLLASEAITLRNKRIERRELAAVRERMVEEAQMTRKQKLAAKKAAREAEREAARARAEERTTSNVKRIRREQTPRCIKCKKRPAIEHELECKTCKAWAQRAAAS